MYCTHIYRTRGVCMHVCCLYMQRIAETSLFGHRKIKMKTAVHKTFPLGVLSVGLLEKFIHLVCARAFSHIFLLYACYAHSLHLWNRCTHRRINVCGLLRSGGVEAYGEFSKSPLSSNRQTLPLLSSVRPLSFPLMV